MRRIAVMFLLLAGVAVLIWPTFHRRQIHHDTVQAVEVFLAEEKEQPYAELYAAMEQYNIELYASGQAGITDSSVFAISAIDLTAYGIEDEIIGVLEIPAMDLKMPIYLGAGDEHLALGVAQLGGSSMPIGGENTNCVLAGHRGWNGADYLRYIDRLEIGDEVLLTNLWETLHYQVSAIEIIAPENIEAVRIKGGQELLTLLSCHPYASGGRQRYVVYCNRV